MKTDLCKFLHELLTYLDSFSAYFLNINEHFFPNKLLKIVHAPTSQMLEMTLTMVTDIQVRMLTGPLQRHTSFFKFYFFQNVTKR